jgi:hypothetical protein
MAKPIKLTQVNIGADRYFHKFKRDSDGAIIQVATTKTAYNNLAIANTINPTQTGYKWLSSCSKIGFDTLSSDLQENQYATQANGAQWVRITGYPTTKIPSGYITNNILSEAGVNKIIELNTD